MAGLGIAGNKFFKDRQSMDTPGSNVIGTTAGPGVQTSGFTPNLIGPYGPWAAGLTEKKLPSMSFRRKEWTDISKWRSAAGKRLAERLAIPDIGEMPKVMKVKEYDYDNLHIEELKWKLPYGRPTEAILLKPRNAKGKLPAILAFHDHGGNKYFGTRKITKTSDEQHPLMVNHQHDYYEGNAWANEIAKRGYVVLVSDAFPFASRRVMIQDVPESQRHGLTDENPEDPKNIEAYNEWAGQHEHIMAKSLFSAGTTWPGVFLAEDMKALDILCARPDVDNERVGCAGLSGGGMRTVFAGGFDSRIKCAVCVGFMTTWRDFLLNKSFTHTWMTYVPILPNELDFPEILGLRVPLATLVLNDTDDQLYTIGEMQRAESILKQVFDKAGASKNFKCSYYPGPHKFDAAMQKEAFAWFDKWLKK
ncbi:MAG TPA: alpha/beta hydrolase family protein [Bacteroidales bacterium]|nr:alpha/beta hydrolase family protein [Bacteroidales bacterium]